MSLTTTSLTSATSATAESCFEKPSTLNLLTAIVLIVGAFLAYIPQYHYILKRKSSNGLSYFMLALGLTSNALIAMNSALTTWNKVECCYVNGLGLGDCLANNLSFLQLFGNIVWFAVLYVIFVIYCTVDENQNARQVATIKWRSKLVAGVLVLSLLITALVCSLLYYRYNFNAKPILRLADWLGYAGGACVIAMYLPQLRTTWSLQDAGSLSVPTTILLMLGQLVAAVFQASLNGAPLSTWLPSVFAFVEMFLLLLMIWWFWMRRKRNGGASKLSETKTLLEE